MKTKIPTSTNHNLNTQKPTTIPTTIVRTKSKVIELHHLVNKLVNQTQNSTITKSQTQDTRTNNKDETWCALTQFLTHRNVQLLFKIQNGQQIFFTHSRISSACMHDVVS